MGHLVAVFDDIFKAANLGARLKPYEIMATSPTAGVIEVSRLDWGRRWSLSCDSVLGACVAIESRVRVTARGHGWKGVEEW